MNTRASVAYGWGILCLAGGGAYYFAKRSINADRAERAAENERRRQQREQLRALETHSRDTQLKTKPRGIAPNTEKPHDSDPEAAEHEPPRDSKFAAKETWKSKKGDRFS